MRVIFCLAVALGLTVGVSAGRADPAHVYAAGSLVAPLKQAVAAAGFEASQISDPVSGSKRAKPPISIYPQIWNIRARWPRNGTRW
jgi:hypothetical protein